MGTVANPAPRRGARVSSRAAGHSGVSIVFAMAAIALAVGAVSFLVSTQLAASHSSGLRNEIGVLSAQVASVHDELVRQGGHIKAVQSGISAARTGALKDSISGLERSVSGLRSVIGRLDVCVSGLQQEVQRQALVTVRSRGFLTAAHIENGAPLGPYCTTKLSGSLAEGY